MGIVKHDVEIAAFCARNLDVERRIILDLEGIIIGIGLANGEFILVVFAIDELDFSGSFEEYRLRTVIFEVLCTIYVYFECMLAGSVICATG